MKRIRKRSIERFGERVLTGGDLYQSEEKFISLAEKRTPEKVEKWLAGRTCSVLRLDSSKPASELVAEAKNYLKNINNFT